MTQSSAITTKPSVGLELIAAIISCIASFSFPCVTVNETVSDCGPAVVGSTRMLSKYKDIVPSAVGFMYLNEDAGYITDPGPSTSPAEPSSAISVTCLKYKKFVFSILFFLIN